ncbi:hypothetical protein, conserved [Leishmania tarentolae]|uniref:Uncharacterized protein n=1 Tax=Leishmania tarentolae TaxID=5689 RepID=A0A640KRD9_LEITA|nr:hypothetical protein, conserved [Leishmania tarentolae]
MRAPIPPPGRRSGYRTSTGRAGSASSSVFPRQSSTPLLQNSTGESEMCTNAHLPPRASSTPYGAHTRVASQHHHSLPLEQAQASSAWAESCVMRGLVFEAEAEIPKSLPHHHRSDPIAFDAPIVESMQKTATDPPRQRRESATTPKIGSVDADVSDLTAVAPSAPRKPPSLTPPSRAPGDLTWCVTVLQAFLRSRCYHRISLDTEVGRDSGKHAYRGSDTIEVPHRLCPEEAWTLKSERPSHIAHVNRTTVLEGDATSRDAQPHSLASRSVADLMVQRTVLRTSQPTRRSVSDVLVSGTAGSMHCSKPAIQPFSSALSPSWTTLGHPPYIESGASHAEASVTGKEAIILDAHHCDEGVCADFASPERKLPSGPAGKDASADRHMGLEKSGGEYGGHVTVEALSKRRKSTIPYESDDEVASSGSAAREPSGFRNPDRCHCEGFHSARGSVDAYASTAKRTYLVTCDASEAPAVASVRSPIHYEKNKRENHHLCESRAADNAVILDVGSLDAGWRSRVPVPSTTLEGREGNRCTGDAPASTSKTSTHDPLEKGESDKVEMLVDGRQDALGSALALATSTSVREEVEADSFSVWQRLNMRDKKGNIMTSMAMHFHEKDPHLVREAEARDIAAQWTSSSSRTAVGEALIAGQAKLTCAEVAVPDWFLARQPTTLNNIPSSPATLADVAEACASVADANSDVPKVSSPSPRSSDVCIGTKKPFLSPQDQEEKEGEMTAVPAPASLAHHSHSPMLQAPQNTCQKLDQVSGSNSAGIGLASEADSSKACQAAHAARSDRGCEDDVGDKTAIRKAILSDALTLPSAPSAGADIACLSSVEDTAPPGKPSSLVASLATPVRVTACVHEAQQKMGDHASMCTADLEFECDDRPASKALHQKIEEEGGDVLHKVGSAAPVLNAASEGKAASSDREAASCAEEVTSSTDALAVAVTLSYEATEEQRTTSAVKDAHLHQQSPTAALSSFSPACRSRESCRGDSPATTGATRPPPNEGAHLQWPQDLVDTKTTAEEESAEVNETVQQGGSPEEAVGVLQPLATPSPRHGRVFVFAPHKVTTSASIEPTNVDFSFCSGASGEHIRSSTGTPRQPAATLGTEAVEDATEKPVLLHKVGGSCASGSSCGPLGLNEGYCCALAVMEYAAAEHGTTNYRTEPIISTTTQVTQQQQSSPRSAPDDDNRRPSDGESSMRSVRRPQVKPEAAEVEKAIAVSPTMAQSPTMTRDRFPVPSASVAVVVPSEAPVAVSESVAEAEDKDVKQSHRAQQALLLTRETDIIENVDTSPPCTTGAPNTRELLDSSESPYSSPALASTAASVAVAPSKAPKGSGCTAELRITQLTCVDSPVSLRTESPVALPKSGEQPAGLLSPRNCHLDREGDLLDVAHGGEIDKATPSGKGDALTSSEVERSLEAGANHPANEVKGGMTDAHENASVSYEGAHEAGRPRARSLQVIFSCLIYERPFVRHRHNSSWARTGLLGTL